MPFEYSAAQMALLEKIKTGSLDAELGGTMENYFEQFGVSEFERPIFERMWLSPVIGNRAAAIRGLVIFGKFRGYEAQALLLHYQGRDHPDCMHHYSAIDYLARMAEMGSADADRALTLLNRDKYVADMYGGDDDCLPPSHEAPDDMG